MVILIAMIIFHISVQETVIENLPEAEEKYLSDESIARYLVGLQGRVRQSYLLLLIAPSRKNKYPYERS